MRVLLVRGNIIIYVFLGKKCTIIELIVHLIHIKRHFYLFLLVRKKSDNLCIFLTNGEAICCWVVSVHVIGFLSYFKSNAISMLQLKA